MFSLKDLGWIILGLALLVLIVYLIITFANLIKTLKKANSVLDDIKIMTEIASERAVTLNKMAEGAAEDLKEFLDALTPAIGNVFKSIANRITDGGKKKEEKKKAKEVEKFARRAERQARIAAREAEGAEVQGIKYETPEGGVEVSETTIHTLDGDVKVEEYKAIENDAPGMK